MTPSFAPSFARAVGLPLLCVAALLTACGTTRHAPAAGNLVPNENLLLQGVPPVPIALVQQIDKYTDFRGHALVGWQPARGELLVAHRQGGADTPQLFTVAGAAAAPKQLTDFPDPVTEGSYEPLEGRYLVFSRASGGNEANQLYRLDPATRTVTHLTDADERNDAGGWLHRSAQLLYTSVPLDRTAEGGSRSDPGTTLWLIDPLQPQGKRKVADLPGVGWDIGPVSHDDKQVALVKGVSANESRVWLLDLASGSLKQLLPAPGERMKAVHTPVDFTHDGKGLLLVSDRAGEFQELMRLDLGSGAFTRITESIHWDVESATVSDDGQRIAAIVNVDGREELRLFDGTTLAELPRPPLQGGSVFKAVFQPKSHRLAVSVDSTQGPSQIFVIDAGGAQPQAWTVPYAPPGIDTAQFPPQRIARWTSFDGLQMSAIVSPPPARFTGKRPVIVRVHGGPEGQATLGFLGRWNYLTNELGITVIEPNVRGSTGYGKTFLTLDNGMKREDTVKDLGTLLDWIATQPDLDASRVLVEGGSYGGYMALAASTNLADRIAGAVDVVGISNFVTFLTNTESYRRDLRRVEYGDERDPAMRAFLERISPLNNAQKITKPLFVVQGKNDPRVPYTEAEQIVARLRDQGTTVWYLRAENEGHGFRRKENADYQFYAMVLFLQQTLLKPR